MKIHFLHSLIFVSLSGTLFPLATGSIHCQNILPEFYPVFTKASLWTDLIIPAVLRKKIASSYFLHDNKLL